jgi:flagellar motor switch protein FliM
MHTQFANVATPSEIVVVTTFNIELGDSSGVFHVCIPYATIEPIRDVLYSPMQGDSYEPDRRWVRMLSKQVQLAEVELVANFTRVPVRLQKLLEMKVGDLLDIDLPKSVVAEVDGVPVFECKYGAQNGQYALRVERVLAIPPHENQLGE